MANNGVRAYLVSLGVKNCEVADELGYTKHYFSRLLSGELTRIKELEIIEAAERVAKRKEQ